MQSPSLTKSTLFEEPDRRLPLVLVHLLTQLRHPLHDSQEDGERDSGLILRVGLPHYFGQGLICGTFLYVLKTTLKLHFPLYT